MGAALVIVVVADVFEADRLGEYTGLTSVQFSVCAIVVVMLIGAIKEHSL